MMEYAGAIAPVRWRSRVGGFDAIGAELLRHSKEGEKKSDLKNSFDDLFGIGSGSLRHTSCDP
jgi:hypothetical protein